MSSRTITIPDHLAHRPVVGGLIVPWVTIWSAESKHTGEVYRTRTGLDGKFLEHRWGMTLISTPNDEHGRPEWKATHSHRQRRCMIGPRCQVCGRKIEGDPVFIIPDSGGTRDLWERTGTTKQPPVCEPCLDAALVWCPHLRHVPPPHVVRGRPRLEGVTGDYLLPDGSLDPFVWVTLDQPGRQWVLGRELVVSVEGHHRNLEPLQSETVGLR